MAGFVFASVSVLGATPSRAYPRFDNVIQVFRRIFALVVLSD